LREDCGRIPQFRSMPSQITWPRLSNATTFGFPAGGILMPRDKQSGRGEQLSVKRAIDTFIAMLPLTRVRPQP